MLLVESYPVGFIGADAGVCTGYKSTTYGDLSGETNDYASDLRLLKRSDGGVDIPRVSRQKRAKDEEDLAGLVGWSMAV